MDHPLPSRSGVGALVVALGVALAALAPAGRAPAGPWDDQAYPYAEAPDGDRGFGPRPDPGALRRLFEQPEGDDVRFLADLYGLPTEVEVLAALCAARYEARGYFAMLPGGGDGRDLTALHRRFEELRRRPYAPGSSRDEIAAFARALLDVRFRVRLPLLERRHTDVAQLRGALAILGEHARGRADLVAGEELSTLARRADLAAARLRALRLDLEALYEPAAGAARQRDPEAFQELFEGLALALPSIRRTLPLRDAEVAERARRLVATLFTPRFDQRHARELAGRERGMKAAQVAYEEMLRLLPETREGRAAYDLADLSSSERHRMAAHAGSEALLRDPLHPGVQFAMGLALDFFAGRQVSIPYFDRFLVLRGVRYWDHRTYAYRDLDEREEYALLVVADWRPPLPEDEDEGR